MSADSPQPERIEAGLTPWYHRRMIILLVMFYGFAAYFAYDWQIGYPEKQVIYERYLELKEQGEEGLRLWAEEARENRWSFEDSRTMAPFAATDAKIREQMWGMIVCLVLGAIATGFYLRSAGTRLAVDADNLLLPRHGPIPISAITRVDTRKWLNKGIARLNYQIPGGKSGQAAIDGLKYGGFKGEKPFTPDLILERVVSTFPGELIEIEEEPEEQEQEESAPSDAEANTSPRSSRD